jgi:tetratricopeptide (TPR) repeat protein
VALGCVAGAILLGLLAAAWRQTRYWRDDLTLWSHTLDCTRDNFIAHNQLGNALVDQGQTEQGIAEFREALRIDPNFEQAHYNLGNALRARGEADAGIAEYREALRINPGYDRARSILAKVLSGQGHGAAQGGE